MIELLFSVVIPLYNKEKYISRAISSVLEQTYSKFELIIVNDGSTDSSLEVASKFSDPRIKLLSKENGGESSARNYGISNSKGDFITFLDADDEWFPGYLELFNRAISENKDVNFFAIGYEIIESNGEKNTVKYPVKDKYIRFNLIEYLKQSINMQIASSNTVAISSELTRRVDGFRIGLKRGPDRDYWLRIMLEENWMVFINHIAAAYHREAENRVCNTSNIKAEEDMIFLLDEYIKNFNLDNRTSRILHIYLSHFSINRTIEYYRSGNYYEMSKLIKLVKFSHHYAHKYFFVKIVNKLILLFKKSF